MEEKKLVNFFKTNKPNVCFVGDIHGNFRCLLGIINRINAKDTAFFVCGDCGFGFEKKEHYNQIFNRLNRKFSSHNCEVFFIRGNHDDPSFFSKRLINRKCFKTIPDYSIVQTPTHNILCIGGATSIDRMNRIGAYNNNVFEYIKHHKCSIEEAKNNCRKYYWEKESCVYQEDILSQIKLDNINVDIVCTHTSPSFAKPFSKSNITEWLTLDKELETDIANERNVMDNIYNKLKKDGHSLEKWFYGHFHFHSSEFIDNTHFVMLDMDRNGNADFFPLTV